MKNIIRFAFKAVRNFAFSRINPQNTKGSRFIYLQIIKQYDLLYISKELIADGIIPA